MGSIGAPEILVILVVALIVLGPNRLPEAARQVGRAMSEFRRISAGFQAELRDAINPPVVSAPPASSAAPAAETPSALEGDPQPPVVLGDLPTSPDQAELRAPGSTPNGSAGSAGGPAAG